MNNPNTIINSPTICSECKIQLAYPSTRLESFSKYEFYYITAGTPFNLSYIDGSDNTYVSGSSVKAFLHKPIHKINNREPDAELTILHKISNGDNFILAIPLINDAQAENSISKYLSGESQILDLGSEIAGTNIIRYMNSTYAIFVCATPLKCNLKSINGLPDVTLSKIYGREMSVTTISPDYVKLIQSPTLLNDEVVCDYESDISEDSAKSSEGNIGLTFAYIIPIILLSIFYMLTIHFNLKEYAWIGIIIGLIVGITGQALILSKKNKSAYTGMTLGGWGFVVLCCYFTFIYKPSGP